ncbi:Atg20p [Nakaseomyces bracarensis]|uniref:Atg20p n=1 Tax=Nakaseomyces bracarensis TaxID=273131 RepID=UPI0038729C81
MGRKNKAKMTKKTTAKLCPDKDTVDGDPPNIGGYSTDVTEAASPGHSDSPGQSDIEGSIEKFEEALDFSKVDENNAEVQVLGNESEGHVGEETSDTKKNELKNEKADVRDDSKETSKNMEHLTDKSDAASEKDESHVLRSPSSTSGDDEGTSSSDKDNTINNVSHSLNDTENSGTDDIPEIKSDDEESLPVKNGSGSLLIPEDKKDDSTVASASTKVGEVKPELPSGMVRQLSKEELLGSKDMNKSCDNIDTSQLRKPLSREISDADVLKASQEMVHTAMLEKDNPFLDTNNSESNDVSSRLANKPPLEKKDSIKDSAVRRSESLHNPNLDYDHDQDEILASTPGEKSLSTRAISSSDGNGNDKEKISKTISPETIANDMKRYGKGHVRILEAKKVSEGQGRTFIAYFIKYNDTIVRRRYSDFESLRSILIKLFPLLIIPPIPEKQSIKTYSKSITGTTSKYLLPSEHVDSVDLSLSVIDNSVSNNDEVMIRHRIRMLTKFLNKLLDNEAITQTSLIDDFLNSNNVNWLDFVNSSPTFSTLPRNPLQSNPLDPMETTRIHACLPIPSALSLGKKELSNLVIDNNNKDEDKVDEFLSHEKEHKRYENIITGSYKYNRRVTKNFNELKHDYQELAEAFAEFASTQQSIPDIASEMSKISDAFDGTSSANETLVSNLYYNINEPINEAIYNANSVTELLNFRKLKVLQLQKLQNSLESKEYSLSKIKFDKHQEDNPSQRKKPQKPPRTSQGYGAMLFGKVSDLANKVKETVNYQEVDPEVASASLTKEIKHLKEALDVAAKDMKAINTAVIGVELPRFSTDREKEVADILSNYSSYMRAYAEKNLEYWKKIKDNRD